jgi:hypothetical protein
LCEAPGAVTIPTQLLEHIRVLHKCTTDLPPSHFTVLLGMPLALAELLLRDTSLGLDHAEPVWFRQYSTGLPNWEPELGVSMYGL